MYLIHSRPTIKRQSAPLPLIPVTQQSSFHVEQLSVADGWARNVLPVSHGCHGHLTVSFLVPEHVTDDVHASKGKLNIRRQCSNPHQSDSVGHLVYLDENPEGLTTDHHS